MSSLLKMVLRWRCLSLYRNSGPGHFFTQSIKNSLGRPWKAVNSQIEHNTWTTRYLGPMRKDDVLPDNQRLRWAQPYSF